MPTIPTIIGFIAAGLVLMTFATKDMRHLRILAILSNIAAISYGVLLWLPPIFGLHLVLLPINAVRLIQMNKTVPGADRGETAVRQKAAPTLAAISFQAHKP
jgi:hypothetical protein